MIRYATYHDTVALKRLLKEVFGDNDRFIDLFFRLKFDGSNVCVYEQDGQIVSMAFLLPATMLLAEGERPVTYLYACATREAFRGSGYMRAIIGRVYADICERGQAALLLMPAEPSLYDYYAQCGFEPFFYWNRLRYESLDFNWRNDHEEYALCRISAARYADFRRRHLTAEGTVHWDLSHLQVLDEDAAGSDDGFYAVMSNGEEKACCLVGLRGDTCEVEEWIGETLPYVQGLFFRTFDLPNVIITTCGTEEKSAMIRFAPSYVHLKNRKGYFNLSIG